MKAVRVLQNKKSLFARIKGKRSTSDFILHCFVFVLFTVFALSYAYVLIWAFLSGLKTHTEVVLDPFSLPDSPKFGHYIEVLSFLEVNENGFFMMLFNSIWFSCLGPAVNILTTSMFAYVSNKYRFPLSKWFYLISLIVMTLPIYGSSGMAYKLYFSLGLTDSYVYPLLNIGTFGVNFLFFYAFYEGLSNTYMESAKIDGANNFIIFFRIVLPLAMPIMGALYLTSWIGSWNGYETALVYYPEIPTLSVAIFTIEKDMQYYVRMDLLFAACVYLTIPPLIIFCCFSKIILNNVSFGGIKE